MFPNDTQKMLSILDELEASETSTSIPPTAPRKTGIERDFGLAAGSLAQAPMMIPNMVGDAANATYNLGVMGVNKLAGTNIPELRYPSQVTEQVAHELFGAPRTVPEKLADTGIKTLAGAGLMKLAAGALEATPTVLREITRAPISKVQKYLPPAPVIVDDLVNVPRLSQARQLMQSSAEELAKAPVVQTVGSLGGTLAAEGGKNMTDNPLVLAALSIGGSVAGGGGASATQRVGGGVKELLKPLYQKGREEIVGETLNRIANDPTMARQALNDAQILVPGSNPTVMQTSRDAGLIKADNAMAGLDDTGRLARRAADQNKARMDQLNSVAGDLGTLRRLRAERAATFDELAEPAFTNAAPINIGRTAADNPVLNQIANIRGSAAGASQSVRKAMDFAEKMLTQEGVDLTDARTLYYIRKDLNKGALGKLSDEPDLRHAKRELGNLVDQLDEIIESGAPGYRDYMDTWAQRSIPIDQAKALQNIRSKAILNTSDPIHNEYIIGNQFSGLVRKNLDDGLNLRGQGPDGGKLNEDQVKAIINIAADIDRGAASSAQTMRTKGSDTFKNLTVAAAIGRVLGQKTGEMMSDTAIAKTVARPISFLYRVPEREMQELLLDAWMDPKLAAKFMGMASDRALEEIGQELKVRAGRQAAAAGLYSGGAE